MVMKCPSCKTGNLLHTYLEDMLPCCTCNQCGGDWVLLGDYLRWKEVLPEAVKQLTGDAQVVAEDSKRALTCPVTGTLMLKYRILGHTDHRLDLSPTVNGIWLDKGEWELLKQEGIADKLNRIFTDPWQKQVRADSTRNTLSAVYAKQFGEADYAKLKDIRMWLQDNPKKAYMMAYLLAEDPYSA